MVKKKECFIPNIRDKTDILSHNLYLTFYKVLTKGLNQINKARKRDKGPQNEKKHKTFICR